MVAPSASELIYLLALAVELGLNVDDLATTFTVYPSLSGSIAEAARRPCTKSTSVLPMPIGRVAPVCGRHQRFPRYWDEFAAFTAACVCA